MDVLLFVDDTKGDIIEKLRFVTLLLLPTIRGEGNIFSDFTDEIELCDSEEFFLCPNRFDGIAPFFIADCQAEYIAITCAGFSVVLSTSSSYVRMHVCVCDV